jgi:hypothetical protein
MGVGTGVGVCVAGGISVVCSDRVDVVADVGIDVDG